MTSANDLSDPTSRPEERPLHANVRWLAATLGRAIARLEGEDAFEAVETLRTQCRARRREEDGAPSLAELVEQIGRAHV